MPWKIYQFDPHSKSWLGFSEQKVQTLPNANSIFSVIPKLPICQTPKDFPALGEELFIWKDLLKDPKNPIDSSDINDIRIFFKVPEEVASNPDKYEIGYHGTSIQYIESIVLNSLLKPESVTSVGKVIEIPPDHIQRNTNLSGMGEVIKNIKNFESAVFLSPSMAYASQDVYSRAFPYVNVARNKSKNKPVETPKYHYPVLECYVKKNEAKDDPKFRKITATTKTYKAHEGEIIDEMEWRIEDPSIIYVSCLHIRSRSGDPHVTKLR